MRNYTIIIRILLVFTLLFIYTKSNAQVGINTTTPRATLDVNGNTKISNHLAVGTINDVKDADAYTFLMQEPSLKIRALDAASATFGNGLGYFMEYKVSNVDGDWLRDLNTGINVTKFTIIVLSSRFDGTIVASIGFSPAFVSAFVYNGTWRLKADYPGVTTPIVNGSTVNGEWNIKLLIISKDLIKVFSPPPTDMLGGATNGAIAALLN